MNNRHVVVLAATLALAWATPAAGQEPDFTFIVPVELHNVDRPNGFHVGCMVMYNGQWSLEGRSQTVQLDANGDYLGGPVTVSFSLPGATDAGNLTVDSYQCGLRWENVGPAQESEARLNTPVAVTVTGPIVHPT